MEEFLGLIVLAITIALITVGVPWFKQRGDSRIVDRYMLAEAYAIGMIALLALGVTLVVHDLSVAWSAGETTHVIIGLGGIAVLIVAAKIGRSLFAGRSAA